MTEQTARQKAGELTREQVADYLRANPDFFLIRMNCCAA